MRILLAVLLLFGARCFAASPVFLGSTSDYITNSGGTITFVFSNRTVMTYNRTNGAVRISAAPAGATASRLSVEDTNGVNTLFLVNSNGGHTSITTSNSSFATLPRSDGGGVVNGWFINSTNNAPDASGGGRYNGFWSGSQDCSGFASSGGAVNGYFSLSTNCSPNTGSGGLFGGFFNSAQNCSPLAFNGGFISGAFTTSTNCSPNASSGGHVNGVWVNSTNCSPNGSNGGYVHGNFNTCMNCSPLGNTGGFLTAQFNSSTNCSPVATGGGFVNGMFANTINSTFSAVSSRLFAYTDSVNSNIWTSLRGGSISATATNSTNIVLHSSDGSLISGLFKDNTFLRATNGSFILGQPPAGTTNNVSDGSGLIYGRLGIYHSNSLPTVSVTVSGSPFLFTNTFNYNIFAYVNGGTLGGIGKNGAAIFPTATLGAHTIPLRPNQWISITNSVVPTLTYDPF